MSKTYLFGKFNLAAYTLLAIALFSLLTGGWKWMELMQGQDTSQSGASFQSGLLETLRGIVFGAAGLLFLRQSKFAVWTEGNELVFTAPGYKGKQRHHRDTLETAEARKRALLVRLKNTPAPLHLRSSLGQPKLQELEKEVNAWIQA